MLFRALKRGATLPLIALLTACGANSATAPAPMVTTRVAARPTIDVATKTVVQPVPPTPAPPTSQPASPMATSAGEQNDLPQLALSPDNAPPVPATEVEAPFTASQPVRIVIPDIGLDLETVAVGLDSRQVPIVPRHEPGWFTGSAVPGQGTNVVLWGHVLRWQDAPTVPAPFARIEDLQPGAAIKVITADGKTWSYRVTHQIRARPEDVQLISPTLTERVTLVSCIGDKVVRDGTLSKEFRLVTVAEPVG